MSIQSAEIKVISRAPERERINVSLDLRLIAKLISEGHMCAADLRYLDAVSRQKVSMMLLDVCAAKLGGYAQACQTCESKHYCQKLHSVR